MGPINLYYVEENLGSSSLLSLNLLNCYLPEDCYERMNLGNIGRIPTFFPSFIVLTSLYLKTQHVQFNEVKYILNKYFKHTKKSQNQIFLTKLYPHTH